MSSESSASSLDPITRLLDITGERWSFLILRDLFYGVRRFDALQKHLGISKKVLSQRLNSLVEAEMLIRVPYQERPPRFEYQLTAKGRDFFPVLVAMQSWSNRWLFSEGEQGALLIHSDCGQPLDTKLICSHCEGSVTPARIRPGKREQ
ncbi:helix-turn-helix domain-containing protein [Mariprofundus sp. KV]|uniref:winged helix-turn-helix transcriptional regulator n=1 Tax=Mariprofundus sp. KV TaxID=2608715 RepID=UPI0015A3C24D|nr:helix-turn-helix domain-containing protein [Mariprofundus sp. KV]NWF35423.1 helix-turn-helix transcriptional regulator [Mariprofundus sp. KV]